MLPSPLPLFLREITLLNTVEVAHGRKQDLVASDRLKCHTRGKTAVPDRRKALLDGYDALAERTFDKIPSAIALDLGDTLKGDVTDTVILDVDMQDIVAKETEGLKRIRIGKERIADVTADSERNWC